MPITNQPVVVVAPKDCRYCGHMTMQDRYGSLRTCVHYDADRDNFAPVTTSEPEVQRVAHLMSLRRAA